MKSYTLQLLKGTFTKQEAINLITQMIDVKIKFHENSILKTDNEEDIKMREGRIRQLQKELYEARIYIEHQDQHVELIGEVKL